MDIDPIDSDLKALQVIIYTDWKHFSVGFKVFDIIVLL